MPWHDSDNLNSSVEAFMSIVGGIVSTTHLQQMRYDVAVKRYGNDMEYCMLALLAPLI
ncbi:hypothetical protein [Shewanella frigidimarina]|uniref:hypothetical protein n=1 Tax=Shewanella frigidimarina TaxID=56812 RepID=UPI001404B4CA|nr:hypothetical protein [Shewanella frigidimarina]